MLPYYIGAPLWALKTWKGVFFTAHASASQFLAQYAQFFNAVEGNTTFYATPSEAAVQRWLESTPADFRFSFKFPRLVTHQHHLRNCHAETTAFLKRLEILGERLNGFMIQLPGSFKPEYLHELNQFIKSLPDDYHYSVEVRHADFFTQAEQRQRLNHVLQQHQVNRVVFDSRPVHAAPALDQATREAHERKPRLPVQLDTTATEPVLRYIGHPVFTENEQYLIPWAAQTARWIQAGLKPRIFLHTPSNQQVPELARCFHVLLRQRLPELSDLPAFPCEQGVTQNLFAE